MKNRMHFPDFRFPPILKKLKRGPQIILPKDLGLMVGYTGIGKDSIVIDAGTGSAFAAVFFGNIARKVYTYEIRPDFAEFARKNIRRSELNNVILRQKDVFKGVKEKADLIMLDLPNAEKIFRSKFNLADGGHIVSYLPNFEQVKKFVEAARKKKFETFTVEAIVREIMFREFTRPQTKGLTHTAFLTFARRAQQQNQQPNPQQNVKGQKRK
jgi:tRNA (adenine57-N1/adenine58-N1)-methyltransferase